MGNRPGVTRGKQWLTLEGGVQLLDTPGILWPKFEDPHVGLNLAFCGSIRDEIMDVSELGLKLIETLMGSHQEALAVRYQIDLAECMEAGGPGEDGPPPSPPLAVMEAIARKRGLLLPGKKIDYTRTGRVVLDEFRGGKIGKITLEYPV